MQFSRNDVWVSDCERFTIKHWRKNCYEVSSITGGSHDVEGEIAQGHVTWVTYGYRETLQEAKAWCQELSAAANSNASAAAEPSDTRWHYDGVGYSAPVDSPCPPATKRDWVEHIDAETGARCWRWYGGRRVRAHITLSGGRLEWCVSREGELPLRWFECDSLELAKRQAEEFCETIPEVGPMQDLTPADW